MALENVAQFQEWYLAAARRDLAHLTQQGVLAGKAGHPGEFKLRPWKAPAVAIRLLSHARRNRLGEALKKKQAAHQVAAELTEGEKERYGNLGEAKYLEFYRRDKVDASTLRLLGWTGKGMALCLMLVVLLLFSFANGSLDARTVGIIVAVLVVHELGHVVMMVLFRFRDLNVLFLPLIARLAPHRNYQLSAWKEFLILLMGPLPGLVAGWGLQKRGWTRYVDRIVRLGCSKRLGVLGSAVTLVIFATLRLSPALVLGAVMVSENKVIDAGEQVLKARLTELSPEVQWRSVAVSEATRSLLQDLRENQ